MIRRTYFVHGEITSEGYLAERKFTFYVLRTYTSIFAPNTDNVLESVIADKIEECGFGSMVSVMIISFNRV